MLYELNNNDFSVVNKIRAFLKKNVNSDYMQSVEWNVIRNEKVKYFLYYIVDNKIVWTCNLLVKEKNGKKFLYAPRGPVFINSNFNLINCFLEQIKLWMKKNSYFKLVINPYLKYDDLKKISSNHKFVITKKDDYINLLDSCKLAIVDIIFDEEKMINKLPSKFRQNTRRSYRKKITSKFSKKVNLDIFYKLYLETAERHSFNPHTIDYFKKLIEVFKKNLIFFEVYYNDIPLAMSIDIIYNNKLIYLYGVSSTNNRNLLGMYNLQWESIRYCIDNKISSYDLGGVFCEEDQYDNKDYGLYKFKKGYCYNGFIDVVPDLSFYVSN